MFITFEGIDFCGKSTQVSLLKKYLINRGNKVELIREPGGTVISEKIRNLLLDKKNFNMVSETEIFLFSSARAQLVKEKIIPWLKEGVYVISDRFHDSSTAYQGFGRGIDLESVKVINKFAIGTAIPDITFFIDIPVEIAEERKKKVSPLSLDRMEILDKQFFNRVRAGYLYLSENEKRFRKIDGTKSIEEIHDYIKAEIEMIETRPVYENE